MSKGGKIAIAVIVLIIIAAIAIVCVYFFVIKPRQQAGKFRRIEDEQLVV